MEYILWALYGIGGQILIGFFLARALKFSNKIIFLVVYSLITGGVGIIRTILMYQGIGWWKTFGNVNTILHVLVIMSMSRSQSWKKILAAMLVLAITIVSELLAAVTYPFPKPEHFPVGEGAIAYGGWISLHLFLGIKILEFLWDRSLTEVKNYKSYFLIVFPLAGNLYLATIGAYALFGDNYWKNSTYVWQLFPMIVSVVSVCLVLNRQNRKEQAEEELQVIEYKLAMERIHYQRIEESAEGTARLRHDFNNRLLTARRMMEDGNAKEGAELLRKMEKGLKEE